MAAFNGEYSKVRYFVEVKKVNVNDSTFDCAMIEDGEQTPLLAALVSMKFI